MILHKIKNIFKQEPLENDLSPRGVRSTYGECGTISEVTQHLFNESMKIW